MTQNYKEEFIYEEFRNEIAFIFDMRH